MSATLCLCLAAAVTLGGYFLRAKVREVSVKLLFSLGYIVYAKTRLGYLLHVWRLNRRRGTPAHSHTQPLSLSSVSIVPVAVLKDNYSYVVVDQDSRAAVLIDPADPQAVMTCLQQLDVVPKAILTTHYHWDHAGGNRVLRREFPGIPVYGGAQEHVDGSTHTLQDKETVTAEKLTFQALWTPGHTAGHIVFKLKTEPPCLFTGDHIFIGGSGRMFEGNAETMLASILRIVGLPQTTLLFPGHEYSWQNLQFALQLVPSSVAIRSKLQWVREQRARKLTTVPSVLSEELQYNLFMCTDSQELKSALGLSPHTSQAQVLSELRRRKNAYKPYSNTARDY